MSLPLSDVIKQKAGKELRILEFEESGKIIRALLPLYGRTPAWEIFQIPFTGGTSDGWLAVALKCTYNFHLNHILPAGANKKSVKNQCLEVLNTLNLPYYTSPRCIYIYIPLGTYLSSFETSDDPEIWKKLQKQFEDEAKIREVQKALDRR